MSTLSRRESTGERCDSFSTIEIDLHGNVSALMDDNDNVSRTGDVEPVENGDAPQRRMVFGPGLAIVG